MNLKMDKGLLLAILFLFGLGLVQVYSTSFIFATETYQDGLYFFRKQLFFAVVAFIILLVVALLPWKWVYRLGLGAWAAAVLGVLLTFLPHLGIRVGGAHRWIELPFGFRFEPAELLRVTYPFVIAHFVAQFAKARRDMMELDRRWWGLLGLALLPLPILLKQPDFGSFFICSSIIYILFFAFGMRWRYVAATVAVAIPSMVLVMIAAPYRYARIQTFLNPWADPAKKGFQVIQSLLSFHSGGLTGVGLGLSQGKLFFLPEAHTDFTLAVLGEEMGFIGFAVLMLVYGFVIFRGFQIALMNQTYRERAVALGLSLVLGFSVFINVGVVLGLLPTKGLTLPLLSYGGSSLLCTAFALGGLLCLERQARRRLRYNEREVEDDL